MACLALWILVVGTRILYLEGSVPSDHTSDCVPVCEDDRIDPIDPEVVSRKKRHACSCWSPSNVRVSLIGNSLIINNTIYVRWDPFYDQNDMRIMVEDLESRIMKDNRKIKNYQLIRQRLQYITFTGYQPGTYVAVVGAVGCECQAKSDPFTIDRPPVEKAVVDTVSPPLDKAPQVNIIIILGVVGSLAFISVIALGLILIRHRNRQNYNPVKGEEVAMKLGDRLEELIADPEPGAVEQISKRLEKINLGPGIRITTRPSRRRDSENELELWVTPEDANTSAHSSYLSKTRLKVSIDYTEEDPHVLPLRVSVPQDCPHPAFREEQQGSTLDIRRIIQKLMPEFDFQTEAFEEFVDCVRKEAKRMKDNIQNILLISGNGHEHHVEACKELSRLLRTLGKTVNYVLEDDNVRELREDGPSYWMNKKLQASDLVIVVASEYLHKLVDKYTRKVDCVELSGYLGNFAPCVLTQLARRSQGTQVAFVSFGYESEFSEKIQEVSGVNCSMRYDLVRTSGLKGQGQNLALKVFFSRLSSNPALVQRACEQSDMFHSNVNKMKDFLNHNHDWLKENFSSRDSVFPTSSSLCSFLGNSDSVSIEIETCL